MPAAAEGAAEAFSHPGPASSRVALRGRNAAKWRPFPVPRWEKPDSEAGYEVGERRWGAGEGTAGEKATREAREASVAAGPSFLGNGVGRRVREANTRSRFDSSENSVSRPGKGTVTADATEPSCPRGGGGDPLATAVPRRHPFRGLIIEGGAACWSVWRESFSGLGAQGLGLGWSLPCWRGQPASEGGG